MALVRRGNFRLDLRGIDVVGVRGRYRRRPACAPTGQWSRRLAEERVRRRDHLIARPDAFRHEAHQQGVAAGGIRDGIGAGGNTRPVWLRSRPPPARECTAGSPGLRRRPRGFHRGSLAYWAFQIEKRNVYRLGQFDDGGLNGFSCRLFLSIATVRLLRRRSRTVAGGGHASLGRSHEPFNS